MNMSNNATGNIASLSQMAGTLSARGQEFKVGDIVESRNVIVAPEGSKGVVISEYVEDSPPDYDIFWFHLGVGSVFREDIRHCQGTEEKNRCGQCGDNNTCIHLEEICRCDISEFGEWRAEGKLDYDVCRQRKCRHLKVCLSGKWLP